MLPRSTQRTARALAGALFDTGTGIPPARLDWLMHDAGEFLGHAGPKTRWGFIGLLLALEWLPFFFGIFGRFSRLGIEKRERFLERLESSSVAVILAAPKAALGLVYYEHPDVVAELGYGSRA